MGLQLIDKAIGGLAGPMSQYYANYVSALTTIYASSTAQSILSFLRSSDKAVGILLLDMSGGYDSMHIPASVLSGDGATKVFTGGVAVLNVENPLTIRGTVIPLGVSLLHELGHAKQNIERTEWYEAKYAECMRGDDAIAKLVESDPSLKGLSFKLAREKKAELKGQMLAAKKAAKLEIEEDNIQRHEKPILVQLGLPFRDKYD